tara:strand:- start:1051 stop:1671 length:621 start_codon:yes stop_codon:yes gene_type:complete
MRKVQFFATYYQQKERVNTLINSLLMQTADNWELVICSNADDSINEVEITDPRITVKLTEENTGTWGALNRRDYIQNELEDGVLLINTSVEDYYIPKLVEFINEHQDRDFIYWDFSHHHFGYNTNHAISQPRINKMDWGNFAVTSEIAKTITMPDFQVPDPEDNTKMVVANYWKDFKGDGYFVEHVFGQHPDIKSIRIPKILFVKN